MTSRLVRSGPRRARLDLAIWGASLIAGTTIGGTLALRAEPAAATPPPNAAAATIARSPIAAEPPPKTATPPPNAAAATPPPITAAPPPITAPATVAPPPSDPRTLAIASIKDAVTRFLAWSQSHPGARCPDAGALGAPPDPWGHPLRVTCTDQPADQLAGIVSAGPDGATGTRDDIVSWTLGADVTDLVRGPRWRARRGAPHLPSVPPSKPPASTGTGSDTDKDGDGIPDRR